jgi:hypothetical protein
MPARGSAVPLVAVVLDHQVGAGIREVGARDLAAAVEDRVLAHRRAEPRRFEHQRGAHLPAAVGAAEVVPVEQRAQLARAAAAGTHERVGPPPQLADREQAAAEPRLNRDFEYLRDDEPRQVDRGPQRRGDRDRSAPPDIRRQQLTHTVNDDVGRSGAASRGHGDVKFIRTHVLEAPELSRSRVRHETVRPKCRGHGSLSLAARHRRDAKDVGQHERPRTDLDPVVDHAACRAQRDRLRSGEHTELGGRRVFNGPFDTQSVVHGPRRVDGWDSYPGAGAGSAAESASRT